LTMKILIIDNYDSFTYNLVQYIKELGQGEVIVVRNDQISIEEVGQYDTIIISPGPGVPSESGITCEVIRRYHTEKSILGVCLGHQAIGEVFVVPSWSTISNIPGLGQDALDGTGAPGHYGSQVDRIYREW